jgi:hypothetical protein
MAQFTSKELYMMNGGQKLYIYKDGFGDIYHATPAEEKEWQQEIITRDLAKLDTEQNEVSLRFAIDNLIYHGHTTLESILIEKMQQATVKRQIVFAASLWTNYKYPKSYEIILENFKLHRKECLDTVFMALEYFKKHTDAAKFLIGCIEGEDKVLIAKARVTLVMWSYSGVPELRWNNFLENLKPENKGTETFEAGIVKLKNILIR